MSLREIMQEKMDMECDPRRGQQDNGSDEPRRFTEVPVSKTPKSGPSMNDLADEAQQFVGHLRAKYQNYEDQNSIINQVVSTMREIRCTEVEELENKLKRLSVIRESL